MKKLFGVYTKIFKAESDRLTVKIAQSLNMTKDSAHASADSCMPLFDTGKIFSHILFSDSM